MRTIALSFALSLSMALIVMSNAAWAAKPDPKQKFSDARTFYDRGDFAGALALFRQIHEQSGSPNARLYAARSLRELGRLPEAYHEMEATYEEAAREAVYEDKYTLTRDAAAAELTLLGARVARLTVVLDATAAGASVTVDDAPFDQLGVLIAREPKATRVVATLEGRDDVVRKVTLQPGKISFVSIAFPTESAAGDSADGATVSLVTLGLITAGIGVVGAGVFAGTGLVSKQKFDSVSEACGGVKCSDPEQASVIDEGKRLELAANIGLGVGIAGIVVGGTLIAVGAASGENDSEGPVTAWVTPVGGGIGAKFRF
ncbi:hypothetical protein JYT28_00650 [Desulfobulbus sp. AH-315-M07]|nr:hypothetical protein [Desulfobulbus sp. AH-315-M07]